MNKHAFLILAHNKPNQLNFLISLLDDPRNDIYVHIDKKSSLNLESMISTKKSKIYLVNRIDVSWGAFSMVKAEMNLLKSCSKRNYSYVHLISGADFPIKCQDYIHDFFNKHKGEQFIFAHYSDKANKIAMNRLRYYWFLQEDMGSGTNYRNVLKKCIQYGLVHIQKIIGINRISNIDKSAIVYGSQWFSITGDFAKHIVSYDRFITKHCNHTVCCDENIVQLIVNISDFKHNAHLDNNLRFMIWEGGSHPRTLNENDEQNLLETDNLFARKFDCDKYPQTYQMIKHIISANQKQFNENH